VNSILQIIESLTVFGYILIIVGIIVLIVGIVGLLSSQSDESAIRRESRGFILIGFIPIIWGFGKRIQYLLIGIGIVLILLWVLISF